MLFIIILNKKPGRKRITHLTYESNQIAKKGPGHIYFMISHIDATIIPNNINTTAIQNFIFAALRSSLNNHVLKAFRTRSIPAPINITYTKIRKDSIEVAITLCIKY